MTSIEKKSAKVQLQENYRVNLRGPNTEVYAHIVYISNQKCILVYKSKLQMSHRLLRSYNNQVGKIWLTMNQARLGFVLSEIAVCTEAAKVGAKSVK